MVRLSRVADAIADAWFQQATAECDALIRHIVDDPATRSVAGVRALPLFVASITRDLVVAFDQLPAAVADAVHAAVHSAVEFEFAAVAEVLTGPDAGDTSDELRWLACDLVERGRDWVHGRVARLITCAALDRAS